MTCQQTFHERDGLIAKTYLRGGSPLFTLKHAYNALGQRIFEEKKTANWTKRTRYWPSRLLEARRRWVPPLDAGKEQVQGRDDV